MPPGSAPERTIGQLAERASASHDRYTRGPAWGRKPANGPGHNRRAQSTAIGLTGDPVPAGSRSGAMTHRNDQRPASSHARFSSPIRVMPPGRSGDGLPEYPARPADARSALAGEGSVHGETPVLDTLADITAASVQRNSLAPRELMLVRIAALIAVDAPPASYFANAAAAADSGITADDIQAIMIGVAPVVGTARVVSAGGNILRALGFAIAVADAEMASEEDGDSGA
jgi:alkylhydroperoxidase/carboxymuconolactone decarboxylase family protein YurZ